MKAAQPSWLQAPLQAVNLHPEPGVDLDRWAIRLDSTYRQLGDGLAGNPSVRIEDRDGRDHLVLTGLDRLDDPGCISW